MEKKHKPYNKPEILYELELETRAGSSPVDQGIVGFEDIEE